MRRVRQLICLGLVSLIVGCANSNPANSLKDMPPNTGFSVHTVKSGGSDRRYSVFVPRDYDPSKKYPTIVFLHGIGESGNDGVKCTTVGIGPAIARSNGDFPFIVVFPQYGWDWCSDSAGQLVIDVLDDASRQYSIDVERVTLSGMSSGGKGTWALGARYNTRWAALVPMGGYAVTDAVPVLVEVKMPIWALHNSGDFIVPVGGTRTMVEKLKEAGLAVHYTEYDSLGHNCWDKAYDSGELFAWIQEQRKPQPTSAR